MYHENVIARKIQEDDFTQELLDNKNLKKYLSKNTKEGMITLQLSSDNLL